MNRQGDSIQHGNVYLQTHTTLLSMPHSQNVCHICLELRVILHVTLSWVYTNYEQKRVEGQLGGFDCVKRFWTVPI